MFCLPFLLIQDYIFNLCFSLKRQILNHKGLFVAGFQERKKLKKYNDLSKTPVKKEDRQKNNQCGKVNRKLDIRGKVSGTQQISEELGK